MQLVINDEPTLVSDELTLSDLLDELGYTKGAVAVAMAGEFIPRSAYATVTLQNGQALEIVSPMQGG
jgi:sulfur carrier protein